MFTYTVGGDDAGFALIADHVVVLIDRAAGASFVTALYRQLQSTDGGLDAALDAIAQADVTSAVAIVELREARERTLRVAVRGEFSVEMGGGGLTRLGGPSRPDWSMTEASGVHRFTLRAPSDIDRDVDAMPLRSGVVRASRIDFALEAEAPAVSVLPIEEESTRQMPVLRRDAPQRVAPPRAHERLTRLLPADFEPVPAVPTPSAPAPVPVASAPVPPRPAPAIPATLPAHAPLPAGSPLSTTARRSAGVDDDRNDDPSGGAASVPSGWVFGLPDGSELDDRAPIVLGRKPWHRRGRLDDAVHVVVPSPRREISGEHLEIRVAGASATARDLGSTNGTLLFSGDGAPRLLHAGIEVPLSRGDILDLGEGFCVTVGARRPAFARADAVSTPS